MYSLPLPYKVAQLREGDKEAATELEIDLTPVVRDPHKDETAHLLHMCKGLSLAPACTLVGGSVSVNPCMPRLVASVGFLVVSLTSPALSVLLHIVLQDF